MALTVPKNQRLHRFIIFTTFVTFLLIIAGGLVTGNEAGLSVPDWPLSYGSLMPPMEGNIRYEHSHRIIAALVGLLTIILNLWLWRSTEPKHVRILGLITLFVVISQGILGGISVIFLLPLLVSVSHACLAQIFFSMMVILSLLTSSNWKLPQTKIIDDSKPTLKFFCYAIPITIFLQLILGSVLRHSKGTIHPHLTGALFVSILVVWASLRVLYNHPQQWNIVRVALLLVGLLFVQLLLGTGSFLMRLTTGDSPQPTVPLVAVTTAHVAAGALILAASLVFAFETIRSISITNNPLKTVSKTLVSDTVKSL